MKYPRYVIPGFVAAALHVVLLFGIPVAPRPPVRPPGDDKIILRPLPEELLAARRSDPAETQEVRPAPRRSGLSSPTLPERPRAALRADVVIPRIDWQTTVERVVYAPLRHPDGPAGNGAGLWCVDSPGVIDAGCLDRMPRARMQVAPEYPAALRHNGTEGSVMVEFEVDAAGRVVSARILSSTDRELERATLRAVMKWRFEPGRRGGRAVPFRMSVPVDFRLGGD